ncbi:MAG: murein biosynthesis integral membrane protein MurJ [Rhizobiales bacterium 24-66-13]|jgi:putative peptidoglycan lipid II flippase|nr:MAG: murein biosynthesis integral membrane protein MurJ [Rhizobiales bacterium 24-66-13]HQS09841.1 murein biosynthesis integral membrane protein MurJ [Xanthobacteraceae bacterium]HQS46348.1 murein biosynthesis integral membrane protein MurJ [Xanthobacteraceae bacterium]
MFRNILSVGGLTLLSRLAGFVRDVVMAAVLGAGPVADAFLVAFRLPNHFRAIFAEGAFNAAFVPTYARLKEQGGIATARAFADEILTAMALVHGVLLAGALAFTPQFVGLLAPGLADDPERFALAITLTRITFPYLALISVATLISGALNASDRFAMAAASPILLNVCMVGTLLSAAAFPTAGHAAAWGVLISGVGQVILVGWDAERTGIGLRFGRPRLDPGTRQFLKALGPAIIGSAGVQIALFADTIIATFLPTGALSALYYADRINQLPIGVVGIAIGTVLLPEMSRRLAGGDDAGAAHAQARSIELAVLLALPFVVAALLIPDLTMRALFARGAFTRGDAAEAAATLQAYGIGLIAFVVVRAFIAPFHARGDTATPMKAALLAVAINVALKFALMGTLAQVGLALATALGGWINLGLLIWFARRRGLPVGDGTLPGNLVRLAVCGLVLAGVLLGAGPLAAKLTAGFAFAREEVIFLLVVGAGGLAYALSVWAMLGRRFLRGLAGRRATDAVKATRQPD